VVIEALGRQPRDAGALLVKHQDCIMFGKYYWNPEGYHAYFKVLETEAKSLPYSKLDHSFRKMYGLGLPDEVLKNFVL